MRSLSVLALALLMVLSSASMACNDAPPRCPAISDDYMLTYRYLDGAMCNIGPYQITVEANGPAVRTTTENRNDITLYTEVQLRGCSLSLKVEVQSNMTGEMLSSVSGDLTVYNSSSISGVGNGAKFTSDGSAVDCQGKFELTLAPPPADTTNMPLAGMQSL